MAIERYCILGTEDISTNIKTKAKFNVTACNANAQSVNWQWLAESW